MADTKPKWHRRKETRPAEIVEAVLDVFIEHGFAAAKLDDVAKRAGLAKGTLYRYFDTKEDLFRAVVQHAAALNLDTIEKTAKAFQGSIAEIVPLLMMHAAKQISGSRVPALARLVVGESRAFPDLAHIWHDHVVSRLLALLSGLISDAQSRDEVQPGDPTAYAFSIVGPMVTGLLFHELFGSKSPHAPNLSLLAQQHAETVLRGMLTSTARKAAFRTKKSAIVLR